ncbi:hypothetical protein [Nitratiruptor tergarcus]|uniref:Lipoprotein n=1 Tax=Nitratiruptor tergarcus DSM 16512 TaxID=1069081 RepID=A0A1W1WU05_9BACT|nr:hypothetical protein [Nitratiruptor tergarcus]SMC09798.1 hypothetical protein SAMN05660197_1620 [Nitratiruptor tergarcus DSM 16512]
MRKIVSLLFIVIFFAGCFHHVRLNQKLFKSRSGVYSLECGNNYDLCLEKADYQCGPKGYKILSKKYVKKGYSIQVECNK